MYLACLRDAKGVLSAVSLFLVFAGLEGLVPALPFE